MLSSLELRGVLSLCHFHRALASDLPAPQALLEMERKGMLVELTLV